MKTLILYFSVILLFDGSSMAEDEPPVVLLWTNRPSILKRGLVELTYQISNRSNSDKTFHKWVPQTGFVPKANVPNVIPRLSRKDSKDILRLNNYHPRGLLPSSVKVLKVGETVDEVGYFSNTLSDGEYTVWLELRAQPNVKSSEFEISIRGGEILAPRPK